MDDEATDELVDQSLLQMGVLIDQLSLLRGSQDLTGIERDEKQREILLILRTAHLSLSDAAKIGQAQDIQQLALANQTLLDALLLSDQSETCEPQVLTRCLTIMEESVAVLPQLIDQLQGSSDRVRGLDALLDELIRLAGSLPLSVSDYDASSRAGCD